MEVIIRTKLIYVIVLMWGVASAHATSIQTGGDDFNDNSVDPAKWTPFHQEGTAVYSETNQRLEYTSASTAESFIEWAWNGDGLSYTQDWSIVVDTSVLYGSGELAGGKAVYMGLAALASGYWFDVEHGADEFGHSLSTAAGDPLDNELFNEWHGFASTNELNLKISFDAQTKMLQSSYSIGGDFIALTNYSVTGFGMTDSSVFTPSLWIASDALVVPSGKVHMDNFRIFSGGDLDADNDGLPDVWEIQFFGSTNAVNGGVNDDWDGDTRWNIDEYIAGTDPTNSASIFTITQPGPSPSGFVLHWNAISNRAYSVLWTDSLTNTFQALESNITPPQNSYTDTVHAAEAGGFYGLKVQLEN